jgi:hypothetical protein
VLATNVGVAEFRLPIFDCKEEKTNAECQSWDRASGIVRLFERANLRSWVEIAPHIFYHCPQTGAAKYAVLTPASIVLPVISPLSFMSFAVSSRLSGLLTP